MLACMPGGSTTENADEADTLNTTESSESTGSAESGESTGSTESTETTDTSEDSADAETTGEPPPDLPTDPNEDIPPLDEEGCPGIYAQDLLPTFDLTIAPEVWELLVWEWLHGPELDEANEEHHTKRPLEQFAYEDIVIDDAMIRLRGNGNNWDSDDKMQFQIDFNEIDAKGRFLGLRHLAFDAASANRHMLRDRLALSIMRDMDITAPCANNARLNINGEYYGIFTSLEKLDKTFLERSFEDPDGDLWKRANWVIKTNENTATEDRLDALKDADTIAELEAYLDLEQSLRVFAAEAIIPDSDGMWAGGLNFYLYDDPLRGKFVMLPWDLDNTFERFDDPPNGEYPVNPDPVVWEKQTSHGRPWYDLALTDEEWFFYYVEAIEEQYYSSYEEEELHELIDTWTDQIEESVFEDTNKPYSNSKYLDEVEDLHDYIDDRYDFLDEWLECWQEGGEPDVEGYCD